MQYRQEVIDLFTNWQKENPGATVLFKGNWNNELPERIYAYNALPPKQWELQNMYVDLLQKLYNEDFVYGEELSYAVEINYSYPMRFDDVTFKLKGTL